MKDLTLFISFNIFGQFFRLTFLSTPSFLKVELLLAFHFKAISTFYIVEDKIKKIEPYFLTLLFVTPIKCLLFLVTGLRIIICVLVQMYDVFCKLRYSSV